MDNTVESHSKVARLSWEQSQHNVSLTFKGAVDNIVALRHMIGRWDIWRLIGEYSGAGQTRFGRQTSWSNDVLVE